MSRKHSKGTVDCPRGGDLDALWGGVYTIINHQGPAAVVRVFLILKQPPHGHDVISVKSTTKYLEARGYSEFVSIYANMKHVPNPYVYTGSTKEVGANLVVFGEGSQLSFG